MLKKVKEVIIISFGLAHLNSFIKYRLILAIWDSEIDSKNKFDCYKILGHQD